MKYILILLTCILFSATAQTDSTTFDFSTTLNPYGYALHYEGVVLDKTLYLLYNVPGTVTGPRLDKVPDNAIFLTKVIVEHQENLSENSSLLLFSLFQEGEEIHFSDSIHAGITDHFSWTKYPYREKTYSKYYFKAKKNTIQVIKKPETEETYLYLLGLPFLIAFFSCFYYSGQHYSSFTNYLERFDSLGDFIRVKFLDLVGILFLLLVIYFILRFIIKYTLVIDSSHYPLLAHRDYGYLFLSWLAGTTIGLFVQTFRYKKR